LPEQDQVQGPEPETVDAVPETQRFEVGVLVNCPPLEEPHWPLTGSQQQIYGLTDVFSAEQ